MKEPKKTQGGPRESGIRLFRPSGGAARLLYPLLFPFLVPGGPRAAVLSPDAEAVLDFLDARIASAEASQSSRDLFLESLHPEAGCRDWAADSRFRRDPDLAAALEAACPEAFRPPPARPSRPRSRRSHPPEDAPDGGPEAASSPAESPDITPRVRMTQGVRPLGEGASLPALDGSLAGPRFAVLASASGGRLRTRRLILSGTLAGEDCIAQAGHLDLPGSGLPQLDFVSGRGRFAGWSGRSGVDGPLKAHVPTLDGAVLRIGGGLRVGAFGAWNRLNPASGEDGIRRDASAVSLSLGAESPEGREWTLQALHHRLEVGADPAAASAGTVLGAGFSLPGGASAGAGTSVLAVGSAGRLRPGAYGEAALEGGKPGRYLLRARQASPGWSSALSGTPSRLRDTVEGGLILPGRGEGSLEARSRLPLTGFPGPGKDRKAPWIWLEAAGGAAWTLDRETSDPAGAEFLLADAPPWLSYPDLSNPNPPDSSEDAGYPDMRLISGEGRAALHFARWGWYGSGQASLRWRASEPTQSGMSRAYGLSGGHAGGPWRLWGSLACRASTGKPVWPLALEAAWGAPSGHSAAAGFALGDAARPGHSARLTVRQTWRLGARTCLSQALRLPWLNGELGEEMGFQLRLEWNPAKG